MREALEAAWASGSWGQYEGPHCQRLASALAAMHDVDHVLLCCSGTVAVELALRGLKIAPGDEIILAGYDFPGNFRCIEAVGGRPVLAEIDPRTWSLDAAGLEAAIGPQTRAVIVSHLHGGLASMSAICQLAERHGLAVVEDACQAPGAIVEGKRAGTWGDVGVLSFGGSKLLTAGRGGAILTRHADVAQRIKVFCQRGNDAFPLSELQAAVLLPQLQRLAERNATRQARADLLRQRTRRLAALQAVAAPPAGSSASYYKFAWLYRPDAAGRRPAAELAAAARAEGIALDLGFRGFVRRSQRRCRKAGSLQHCAQAADATLLLHHPVLLEPPETIDRVAAGLEKIIRAWMREI